MGISSPLWSSSRPWTGTGSTPIVRRRPLLRTGLKARAHRRKKKYKAPGEQVTPGPMPGRSYCPGGHRAGGVGRVGRRRMAGLVLQEPKDCIHVLCLQAPGHSKSITFSLLYSWGTVVSHITSPINSEAFQESFPSSSLLAGQRGAWTTKCPGWSPSDLAETWGWAAALSRATSARGQHSHPLESPIKQAAPTVANLQCKEKYLLSLIHKVFIFFSIFLT